MLTPGLATWKMTFQLSPVILTGGIASQMPGGALPIIALTETINFPSGILGAGDDIDLDDFFANFEPLPGSSLIDQRIGEYPFANQAVAANAVIQQPLSISLRMICTAQGEAGWAFKTATMAALVATLQQHNQAGGTYTVATPSYVYTNCLLLDLRDTSNSEDTQPQNTYQWDFRQPLLTLQAAQQARSGLMAQISSGSPIGGGATPSYTGLGPSIGNPSSVASPTLYPVASGPSGGSISSAGYGSFGTG